MLISYLYLKSVNGLFYTPFAMYNREFEFTSLFEVLNMDKIQDDIFSADTADKSTTRRGSSDSGRNYLAISSKKAECDETVDRVTSPDLMSPYSSVDRHRGIEWPPLLNWLEPGKKKKG